MFSWFKNLRSKADAISIINQLLQYYERSGVITSPPKLNLGDLAVTLVNSTWNSKPDLYSGKFGQRPHKYTLAMASLLKAQKEASLNEHFMMAKIFERCILDIFREIGVNFNLYPFNSLDIELLSDFSEDIWGEKIDFKNQKESLRTCIKRNINN